MKRPFIILLGLIAFSITGCSTKDAEKTIENFHQHMDAGKFDLICDHLLSQDALNNTSRETWLEMFKTIDGWGERKNRQKKSGFSKKINNGISTVKLKYTFEVDGTVFYESFVISDDGEGEKISVYAVNTDEATVDDYTKDF